MKESILLGLVQNIAILLSFSMLYDYSWSRNENNTFLFKLLAGIILGGIGVLLILTPWHSAPGISFDTRSIFLSVSGLFFGAIPAIIAMIINGIYRLYMGGAGVTMGLAVVFISGTTGLLWRYYRPDWRKKNHLIELAAMGILVHILMLFCVVFLPAKFRWETLTKITLPVILIYPTATILLGSLLLNQKQNRENRKQLGISQERWNFALEGSGDGVWDWNPATNEVFFSRQWKLMLGYEVHEIENKFEEWENRIFSDDRNMVHSQLEQHIKGATPEYISEHRVLCKDGSYKWILDRGKVMVRDAEGNPLRIIGTHTDISEQKHTQEKIKKLNNELEQKVIDRTKQLENRSQELMENQVTLLELVEDLNLKSDQLRKSSGQLQAANKELEAFSYSVSHDLKTPLRAINGFASILSVEYKDLLDNEGQRICSIIQSNAGKMSQLIDDLLAFSRLVRSELHHSKIDMKALVKNIVSEFETSGDISPKTISIQELPEVIGDRNLMKQVLINLISNAIKYSSKELKPEIKVGSFQNKNELIYFIKDNGVGFNMDYAPKLFRVFQRLHRETEFEGTGIGLAIVQRIINRHGGRVWAEGEVGNGAIFYFSLPVNIPHKH